MSTKRSHSLSGSRPPRRAGATREPEADLARPLELTLRMRAKSDGLADHLAAVLEGKRPPLEREEVADRFGASAADRKTVERWAARNDVEVVGCDLARRVIDIRGPAGHLARLFSVKLVRYRRGDTTWVGHEGGIALPKALAAAVLGVVGFDQHPPASRGAAAMDSGSPKPRLSFTPPQIGRYYRFPKGVDGRGQTIGVIALGGGYRRRDLGTFFRHLDVRHPRFTDVSVHGIKNAPEGRTKLFDGEVTGDIETVGSLAPGARIVVYFGPNSERGFFETVSRAVHDRDHRPTVISISWGTNETYWPRRTLRLFDEVLAEAAAMGITVCCAAGDHGALADTGQRVAHVCFPGSSPYVLACGGTSLRRAGGRRLEETTWHDAQGAGGGGISAIFDRPAWQKASGLPRASRRGGRSVPDVAANADPESGYRVFVHGRWVVGAGTSAAAPVWAGLVALFNQLRGEPLGLVTPWLYRRGGDLVQAGALRPVRKGQEGGRASRHSWNRHTGLGVPHGEKLAAALTARRR